MSLESDEKPTEPGLRRRHRTGNSILNAFDAACDSGDQRLALRLLETAESVIARSTGASDEDDQAILARLVAARVRLWSLKRRR